MKEIRFDQIRGAALVVVMLLLIAVSLTGVSSLRSGIFQQQLVSNAQVDALALQATESAINSVLDQGRRSFGGNIKEASYFQTLMTHGKQVNCFNGEVFSIERDDCLHMAVFGSGRGAMSNSLLSKASGQLHAYAVTERKGAMPALGYDVDLFVFHVFDTTGVGYYGDEAAGFAHANTQRWKRFGVALDFDALKPD